MLHYLCTYVSSPFCSQPKTLRVPLNAVIPLHIIVTELNTILVWTVLLLGYFNEMLMLFVSYGMPAVIVSPAPLAL